MERIVPLVVGVLMLGGCAPGPAATPHDSTVAEPSEAAPTASQELPEQTEPAPEGQPEPLPTPTVSVAPAHLSPGDEGDQVRDLQHRLQQLQWYDAKIDGIYGDMTRLAVQGFQAKRGLPVLDFCDEATWQTLKDMTRQPTRDEMYNVLKPGPALLKRGSSGPEVRDLQARLKQLQWYDARVDGSYGAQTEAAVKGFQDKRQIPVTGEVDQRTLDRLRGMSRKPTADELAGTTPTPTPTAAPTDPAPKASPKPEAPAFKLDDRCLTGRVICISKQQRKLAWVLDGQIKTTMEVRFGSELTPTRNGTFSVYWKSRNHVSKLYKTPMPYALFFSGGQAVHYSADFAARGYNGASHGCVNVRDKKAVAALFDMVREGDRVVVY